jgi:hypothetical protein
MNNTMLDGRHFSYTGVRQEIVDLIPHKAMAVVDLGCSNGAPELQWINTVLGNLKTSLSGSYHSFGFRKYAAQYLGTFAHQFNRRFDLKTLTQRLLVAAAQCGQHSQRSIRVVAEVHC